MIEFLSILLVIPFIFWVLKSDKPSSPIEKKEENRSDGIEELVEFEKEFWKGHKEEEEEEEETLKVELMGNSFCLSKIKDYKGEELKKFEFRPQNFNQFIGQDEAKEEAKTIIKLAKRGIKCHFIVNGIRGHGKTTFVELIAKELNAKLIERVGKQVDIKNLPDIIQKEINESKEKYVIFFIDELDTMDWKVLKILNPLIESFKIGGKRVKQFIFAGATINKHMLIEKNPDTMDRIPNPIKFNKYNAGEVARIIKQYKEQLFPEDNVPSKIIDIISKNCKFNPRTSISLLSKFIVEQNIEKILKSAKIVKKGLNTTDIAILKALNNTTRAIGANALAMKVGLSQKEYITEYEPFLVEYDYINRVPSRIITDRGKEIIREINE